MTKHLSHTCSSLIDELMVVKMVNLPPVKYGTEHDITLLNAKLTKFSDYLTAS